MFYFLNFLFVQMNLRFSLLMIKYYVFALLEAYSTNSLSLNQLSNVKKEQQHSALFKDNINLV